MEISRISVVNTFSLVFTLISEERPLTKPLLTPLSMSTYQPRLRPSERVVPVSGKSSLRHFFSQRYLITLRFEERSLQLRKFSEFYCRTFSYDSRYLLESGRFEFNFRVNGIGQECVNNVENWKCVPPTRKML